MYWDSMTDMENYQQPLLRRTVAMEGCEPMGKENLPCSPNSKFQDISMFESNSPSQMSCDGSPNYSFQLRRPSMDILQDNTTQDSGYSPSEVSNSRISPKRHLSYGSNAEEFFDLSELENDSEHQSPKHLPGEFAKLITGSLAQTSSPKCSLNRPPFRKAFSLINNIETSTAHMRARSCLFANTSDSVDIPVGNRSFKRPEPPTTETVSPLSIKRSRFLEGRPIRHIEARSIFKRSISNQEEIKTAIHRSSTDPDLIGDFSKGFCLPLIAGRHQDLKSITSHTVASLMRGDFNDIIASYKIIDCRYPYEFAGGHIEGAQNLYTKQQVLEELLNTKEQDEEDSNNKRHILIFHCEFSSERGPNLSRFLRNIDRRENKDYYPHLHFPEMYLLDGGYKNFFETHGELCTPNGYLPMLHPDHEQNLRYFRAKSKTFNNDFKMSISKQRIFN